MSKTKRKQSKPQLSKLKTDSLESRLQQAQALNRFYAMWVHELRSPLTVLEQLLSTQPTSSEQARYCVRQLNQSVNDLLSLAQMQSGHLQFQAHPFSLSALLDTLQALAKAYAAQLGKLDLAWQWPTADEVDVWLLGDEVRLQQIILNLLTNAIKFTEQGRVSCEVKVNNKGLVCRVRDSGVGMSDAQIKKLKRPFTQFISSASQTTVGSGLGIFIVRQMVAQAGGTLKIKSKPGRGTEVKVKLPWQKTAPPQEKRSDAAFVQDKSAIQVLCVEDCDLTRDYLLSKLHQLGVTSIGFAQARPALDWAKQHSFTHALIDQNLPDMRGQELCQALRQLDREAKIFATSAEVFEDKSTCFDQCYVKPLSDKDLRQILGFATGEFAKKTDNAKKVLCKKVIHDKIPTELTDLVPKFVKEVQNSLGELEKSFALGDYQHMLKLSHKLKGSLMLFNQRALIKQLDRLDQMIRDKVNSAIEQQLAAMWHLITENFINR